MSGSRDAPSLTNKPCQGEDLNNVPQLLYYSMFVRGFILPFNAVKACCFSYSPHPTPTSPPPRLCVSAMAPTGYVSHAQTKLNTHQEEEATRIRHSPQTRCEHPLQEFPLVCDITDRNAHKHTYGEDKDSQKASAVAICVVLFVCTSSSGIHLQTQWGETMLTVREMPAMLADRLSFWINS